MVARPTARLTPVLCAVLATLIVAGSVSAQPIDVERFSHRILVPLPGGPVVFIPKPPAKQGSVTLTPEQYKELLDRLEKLQAQVDAQRPMRPRSCELEGKVEIRGRQAVVHLKAAFKFTTTRPRTLVHLGCQKAHPIDARTEDGKAPLLTAGDDGLRVLAESAGEHVVRLELDVPLSPRGPKVSELGFEIGLPGAPITALSFEAPANVRRYNLTTRTPRLGGAGLVNSETETDQPEAERFAPGKGGVPLGPITNLVMSWEDPERKADTVRSADWDIAITVGLTEVQADVRLRLHGPSAEWKFTSPSNADVSVGIWTRPGAKPTEFASDRAPNVVRPEPGQSVWRIVFREPFAGDLLVTLVMRQPRPRSGEAGSLGPFGIGPFDVLNVPQSNGTIRVKSQANLRATMAVKAESSREVDEATGDAVYRFSRAEVKTPSSEPTATLTLTAVPAIVQARIHHELRLTETGWKLRTEIAVAPSRTEVEHLDIELPKTFRPIQAEPPEIVEDFSALREAGRDRHIHRVRLVAPKRSSFAITIDGEYTLPAAPGRASLALPRLIGVSERASEIVVLAPTRFDVRGSIRTYDNGKVSDRTIPLSPDPSESGLRLRGSVERTIAVAEMTWQPATVDATVQSDADVDIEDARVRIVQRFYYRFSGRVPDRVHLLTSRPIAELQASGGTLEPAGSGWNVILPGSAGRDLAITLMYVAPLNSTESTVALPLLIPDAGDIFQVVRIWSRSNAMPQLIASKDWSESPTEIIAGRSDLPALVARTRGGAMPPTISLKAAPPNLDTGPNIERVRIEVSLGEDNATYRCMYWIRDWRQDLELALPQSTRSAEVFVQRKRVTATVIVPGEPSRIVLRPPAMTHAAALVEIVYRGPIGVLQSPTIVRGRFGGSETWAIEPNSGSIALVPKHAAGDWSMGSFCHVLGISQFLLPDAESSRGIVLAQTNIHQVAAYQGPRTPWVVATSVAVLVICFGLVAVNQRLRFILGGLGLVGLFVGLFLIPQPIAVATFAAIPGLVGFFCVWWTYCVLRWRYRRRVARTTGFARPGLSLTRPSATRSRSSSVREATAGEIVAPSSS